MKADPYLRAALVIPPIAFLVTIGMMARLQALDHPGSDVLTVTHAAISQVLAGGNPYGHGFAVSNPPGAPFVYGPLELLWYAVMPANIELLASLAIMGTLAVSGRLLGLAVYVLVFPVAVFVGDGSNDTSAGLLILGALALAERSPRAGAAGLAIVAAFKLYALAWFIPLLAFAGSGILVPFLAASALIWGPTVLVWGPGSVLASLASGGGVHEVAKRSLAQMLHAQNRALFEVLGYLAGALCAGLSVIFRVRSFDAVIVWGTLIFLATMYLGWWSSWAYLAAVAPVVCWRVDRWALLLAHYAPTTYRKVIPEPHAFIGGEREIN